MKAKWEKTPEELTGFLGETMKDIVAEPKKMFGYPVYFVNGNMLIGSFGKSLFLRISPEEQKEVFRKYEDTANFSPMPGRIMKEYIVIPETIYKNNKKFSVLLSQSLAYTASLPPKAKKKKARKI
ncbi:MAG: TfoX/Sxy family protein [Candidatus Firestonebacteria bacterium]